MKFAIYLYQIHLILSRSDVASFSRSSKNTPDILLIVQFATKEYE